MAQISQHLHQPGPPAARTRIPALPFPCHPMPSHPSGELAYRTGCFEKHRGSKRTEISSSKDPNLHARAHGYDALLAYGALYVGMTGRSRPHSHSRPVNVTGTIRKTCDRDTGSEGRQARRMRNAPSHPPSGLIAMIDLPLPPAAVASRCSHNNNDVP